MSHQGVDSFAIYIYKVNGINASDPLLLISTCKMIIILLYCLCIANGVYGSIPYLSKNEDLDLEQHLEVINKPPIKTIHVLSCSCSYSHLFNFLS